jgi:hypothetical protein
MLGQEHFFFSSNYSLSKIKERSSYIPLMQKVYEGWKPTLESNSSSSPLDVAEVILKAVNANNQKFVI